MKIDSYAVTAQSQRSYTKVEAQNFTFTGTGAQYIGLPEGTDVVELSEGGQKALEDANKGEPGGQGKMRDAGHLGRAGTVNRLGEGIATSKEELKLQILTRFIEMMSGRHYSPRLQQVANDLRARFQPAQPRSIGFAGKLTATNLKYESESVSYQAQGIINTADGKRVSVDISMSMSREYMEYSQTSLEFKGRLCDPIVINYGGTAASLTGEKYAFDLDADGVLDQISFAGAGSGFLALDKNGDGSINDGSELFGPGTGNGFAELRAYDSDGNGWIDENDDIFSKLRIWSKDANGNDQLFTLLELDVGAIYLGDVGTEFSMNDTANNTQGVMRSTSFFLRESGGAGLVHHIDLSV